MIFESQTLISILAIIVLFLSFIASFKHQNALIFITGLLTSLLISKCDKFIPMFQNYFDSTFNLKTSNFTATSTTDVVPLPLPSDTPSVIHVPNDMISDANDPIHPEDARSLVTTNISKLEEYNQQRSVYGLGRPTMGEVLNGTGDLKKLTPDFVTFGHVLVGNLRAENEIDLDANLSVEENPQNPELLKLAKPGLIPSKDYFPNCKLGGVIKNLKKRDRRDINRCDATRHNM